MTFYTLAADDPDLGPLADKFRGLKPPRFPTMFECVANAIACQQLTLTVGITLLNRLAESHGPIAPNSAGRNCAHVSRTRRSRSRHPCRFAGAGLQYSQGVRTARDSRAASMPANSIWSHCNTQHNDDASDSLQHLGGIGRWSAEYALLRGLGRLDVFPGDDVGARNNLARRLGLAVPLDYAGVQQTVARWAPYAGLAYFHLLLERIDEAGWLSGLATT